VFIDIWPPDLVPSDGAIAGVELDSAVDALDPDGAVAAAGTDIGAPWKAHDQSG
jgi:uncharacterized protein (DUF736 family)